MLCGCSFARINVRNDSEVPDFFQIVLILPLRYLQACWINKNGLLDQ